MVKFNVAFDKNHFLRNSENESKCFDRAAYDETSMRYALYHSGDGGRVNRNSGFPIKFTQDNSEYFGWIGFWGVWFPEEMEVNNGVTVFKLDYGSEEEEGEAFTVFKSNGKLIKNTKKTLKLGDIQNIPLQIFNDEEMTEIQVEWDGAQFNKTAKLNESSYVWESITPPETFIFDANNPFFDFWSDALGGSGFINVSNPETGEVATLDNNTEVVFYLEDVVYPSDSVPETLACMEECPDPDNLASGNPFFTEDYQEQQVPPSEAQYFSYSFNKDDMLLKKDGKGVASSSENPNFSDGLQTGPLFEPTRENLEKLACEWDPNYTCAWQAWDQMDVFYTWETGPNDWNHFTALKDENGNLLTFEPPLNVKYVHTWEDQNTSTFQLEYNGFGDLEGIPGKCVNWDTGEDIDCEGDDEDVRWIPEFSIPDGTTVTDSSDNQTEYMVKALEKERRMKALDLSECSSLTITSYDLPSINEWKDPNIGDMPEVNKAPAVIGGVVQ